MLSLKKGLVFQGGGVLGISYIGALQELKDKIACTYFAGSSIGSVIALVMACNIDINVLEKYILDLDISSCIDNINYLTGLWRLYYYNGWHDIGILKEKLKVLIKTITGKENLSFADIKLEYGNHLGIMAFSLVEGKTMVFDPISTPDANVIDACIHSCTVPFFFKSGDFVDGGLDDNYPIKYMKKLIGAEKTLGLELVNEKAVYLKPVGFYDFTKFILDTVFNNSLKPHLSATEKMDTIKIKIGANMSFLNFNLSLKEKMELIQDGQLAIKHYLSF